MSALLVAAVARDRRHPSRNWIKTFAAAFLSVAFAASIVHAEEQKTNSLDVVKKASDFVFNAAVGLAKASKDLPGVHWANPPVGATPGEAVAWIVTTSLVSTVAGPEVAKKLGDSWKAKAGVAALIAAGAALPVSVTAALAAGGIALISSVVDSGIAASGCAPSLQAPARSVAAGVIAGCGALVVGGPFLPVAGVVAIGTLVTQQIGQKIDDLQTFLNDPKNGFVQPTGPSSPDRVFDPPPNVLSNSMVPNEYAYPPPYADPPPRPFSNDPKNGFVQPSPPDRVFDPPPNVLSNSMVPNDYAYPPPYADPPPRPARPDPVPNSVNQFPPLSPMPDTPDQTPEPGRFVPRPPTTTATPPPAPLRPPPATTIPRPPTTTAAIPPTLNLPPPPPSTPGPTDQSKTNWGCDARGAPYVCRYGPNAKGRTSNAGSSTGYCLTPGEVEYTKKICDNGGGVFSAGPSSGSQTPPSTASTTPVVPLPPPHSADVPRPPTPHSLKPTTPLMSIIIPEGSVSYPPPVAPMMPPHRTPGTSGSYTPPTPPPMPSHQTPATSAANTPTVPTLTPPHQPPSLSGTQGTSQVTVRDPNLTPPHQNGPLQGPHVNVYGPNTGAPVHQNNPPGVPHVNVRDPNPPPHHHSDPPRRPHVNISPAPPRHVNIVTPHPSRPISVPHVFRPQHVFNPRPRGRRR